MSAPGAPAGAREAGRRIEEILDGFAAAGDPAALAAAEDLVRVLMEFYGAGLARVVAALDPARLAGLAGDELVGGLLALHGLHPEDARTRIDRVLAAAPEPVELVALDEAGGVLWLRQTGSGGCGCGGSGTEALRRALEDAVGALVPEVTAVELEPADRRAPQPVLLQIGTRPTAPARVP
ncbi:hypothetical protein [Streptomyces sp. NPDC086023]|uniref:hypothetical protein n=1 Tax=Streptomyces sp. NPDC086023 TaxID=3365746 RepID=UPI0037D0FF95